MTLKWKKAKTRGDWIAEGKYGHYIIIGYAGAWWAEYHSNKQYVVQNLGWSPTMDLAKKRCDDLEEYFVSKKTDECVNRW